MYKYTKLRWKSTSNGNTRHNFLGLRGIHTQTDMEINRTEGNQEDYHNLLPETSNNSTFPPCDALHGIRKEECWSNESHTNWTWRDDDMERNITKNSTNGKTENKRMSMKKKNKHQSSVQFSDPIAQVQYVSMSEDSRDARMSYWTQVAADAERFRERIRELESAMSRLFEKRHRNHMRNYIKVKLESVCVPE